MFACLAVLAGIVTGEQPDQREAIVTKGLRLLEEGRYKEAANYFEEAWESDSSDALVGENYALCLLHGRRAVGEAVSVFDKVRALGGWSSVLVHHIHENALLSGGVTSDFCPGRLRIGKDVLVFESSNPAHSVRLEAAQIRGIRLNRLLGSAEKAFHIETIHKKKINFRPASSPEEVYAVIERMVLILINRKE